MNVLFDLAGEGSFGKTELIGLLQVHPEFRRGVECLGSGLVIRQILSVGIRDGPSTSTPIFPCPVSRDPFEVRSCTATS